MTAMMPLLASGRQPVTQGPGSVRPSRLLATATRRPQLRAGLIGLVAGAIATGTMGVVVPLELHAAGESTGTIGLILFGTGLGYVAATGVITRLGCQDRGHAHGADDGRGTGNRDAAVLAQQIGRRDDRRRSADHSAARRDGHALFRAGEARGAESVTPP